VTSWGSLGIVLQVLDYDRDELVITWLIIDELGITWLVFG
jgi:hypothetical protein